MSKPNRRRIRLGQFKQQLAEAMDLEDGLLPVELADDDPTQIVYLRLPLDDKEIKKIRDDIEATDDEDRRLQLLFAEVDGHTVEAQLAAWRAAGGTDTELPQLWSTELQGLQERLGKYRYQS